MTVDDMHERDEIMSSEACWYLKLYVKNTFNHGRKDMLMSWDLGKLFKIVSQIWKCYIDTFYKTIHVQPRHMHMQKHMHVICYTFTHSSLFRIQTHEHNGPYNRKFLSTKILDLLNFVRKMLSSFINLPSPYILQPSYTLMCETNLTLWCITKHIALFSFMLRIWTWKYIITILCNAKGDFNYQEKFYDILAKM